MIGLFTSLGISRVRAADPAREFRGNPLSDLVGQLHIIAKDRVLNWAVVGNTYLWFLAALLQFVIVVYGHDSLQVDETQISYLQAAVGIGIGLGSPPPVIFRAEKRPATGAAGCDGNDAVRISGLAARPWHLGSARGSLFSWDSGLLRCAGERADPTSSFIRTEGRSYCRGESALVYRRVPRRGSLFRVIHGCALEARTDFSCRRDHDAWRPRFTRSS